MSAVFYYLCPELITPRILEEQIYPDMEQEYYWSDCWSLEFFRDLARVGFIPIAITNKENGHFLLPEMQKSYTLLDWRNIHVSAQVKKLIRRGDLMEDETYLIIDKNTDAVIQGIQESYGSRCWLNQTYRELMKRLEDFSDGGFSLFSIQLRSGKHDRLLGGELGYSIGGTYTSLTGFLDRSNPACNNKGTIQLLSLARLLEENGYAFWNLGHPSMRYKTDLGARIVPRHEFLPRWKPACERRPTLPLVKCLGIRYSCQELLNFRQRDPH